MFAVQEQFKKRVKDIITQYPLEVKPRKAVLRGLRSASPVQPADLDQEDPIITQLPPPIIPQVHIESVSPTQLQ